MKEIQLQRQIKDYINLMGGYVYRANSGKFIITGKGGKQRMFTAGIKGLSDIAGTWKDGRSIACEVKIAPNKPSEYQLRYLEEVKKRGGIAILAYSLEDVIDNLK